jgi:hypothetical protein
VPAEGAGFGRQGRKRGILGLLLFYDWGRSYLSIVFIKRRQKIIFKLLLFFYQK